MVVVANDLGAPTNAPAGCRLPAIATNERSRALEILLAIIEVGLKEAKSGNGWALYASVAGTGGGPAGIRAGLRVIGDNDTCTAVSFISGERDGILYLLVGYTYRTVP